MAVQRTFTDIDEHAAQMSGFEQRYVQLSPGAFRGVFSSLVLPRGLGLDVEWVAQALHQQAGVPAETVSLVTFLDLEGRAIFNGRALKRFDTFVLPPGASLDVRTPPNATVAVVTLPVAVLRDEASAWAGPSCAIRELGTTRLLTPEACAARWAPVLAPLLTALQTRPESLRGAASLADDLLDATLALLGDDAVAGDDPDIACARRRREAYLATRDAIDRLDPSALTIGALCRMAGVSRRTLEYSFDEAVATSPSQYLKIRRLNGVRRDLMAAPDAAATTVGDVAARHGLWHLSRLSHDYARLFGELPSATLRRGDRRAAAPGRRGADLAARDAAVRRPQASHSSYSATPAGPRQSARRRSASGTRGAPMRLIASCDMTLEAAENCPAVGMLRPRSGQAQWLAAESYDFQPRVEITEYVDVYGNLCQRFVVPQGRMRIQFSATVETEDSIAVDPSAPATPVAAMPDAALLFLLPSRYCTSDTMESKAREVVGNAAPGYAQVEAIRAWIHANLKYQYGVSNASTDAAGTLQQGAGVCRDFSHVGIALCRSLRIPARMVVGYLHGLDPMDLHAWFEAFVGGRWYTFDATQAHARGGRIVVAYGRDAGDVAFISNYGPLTTPELKVSVELADN